MKSFLLLLVFLSTRLVNAQICPSIQATKSNPIVLNNISNQTISGLRISNPNGACIVINNGHNITISNCILGPSIGDGITLLAEKMRYDTVLRQIEIIGEAANKISSDLKSKTDYIE